MSGCLENLPDFQNILSILLIGMLNFKAWLCLWKGAGKWLQLWLAGAQVEGINTPRQPDGLQSQQSPGKGSRQQKRVSCSIFQEPPAMLCLWLPGLLLLGSYLPLFAIWKVRGVYVPCCPSCLPGTWVSFLPLAECGIAMLPIRPCSTVFLMQALVPPCFLPFPPKKITGPVQCQLPLFWLVLFAT